MDFIDKIENLPLKRRAIESVLSDEANRELIADRVILLLDGDIDKLDMLISGIPNDFSNAGEKLKAENFALSKIDNVRKITGIAPGDKCNTYRFYYTFTARRYIRPGDTEGRKIVEEGKYYEQAKYYKDSEYSEEVNYEDSSFTEFTVHDLENAGVKFSKL